MQKHLCAILGLIGFAVTGSAQSTSCGQQNTTSNLMVQTRTGTFIGNLNDTYPDVRQFKYVPYAKPPVGSRRWASPEPLDDSHKVIPSTSFGPACLQYVSAIPLVWALNITGNQIVNYGQSLLAGETAQNSAEDCLTLSIWTPANATAGSNLPVIHFLTGGGDVTGGTNIPTQMPPHWVHRSQSHIVVTTNYRVNIFGYPHAKGLNGNDNFGMQDQRMAVEWVSENIAAFGGDPGKITLWGQSAGAITTDAYLFAWPEDPIVRATISSSGTANFPSQGMDYEGTNFTFVAKSLGCDFDDAKLELECMRHIPAMRMENFVGQYQDNSTLVKPSQAPISFLHQADGKIVFKNYTERYLNGQVAKIPKMIGTAADEGSALTYVPLSNYTAGPSPQLVLHETLNFVCASYNTSEMREQQGLATYRYQWAGNFTNLSPMPWLGAYHYSDLYMIFGTYIITPGTAPTVEVQTSQKMQDLLLAFIQDPSSLPSHGWPMYNISSEGGGQLARFGGDEKVMQLVDGNSVEGACHIPGDTYNESP